MVEEKDNRIEWVRPEKGPGFIRIPRVGRGGRRGLGRVFSRVFRSLEGIFGIGDNSGFTTEEWVKSYSRGKLGY